MGREVRPLGVESSMGGRGGAKSLRSGVGGRRQMSSRVVPYVAIVVAALGFFGPLVMNPGGVLYSDSSDLIGLHVAPWRFLVRSWQQTGEVPLWNPYSF